MSADNSLLPPTSLTATINTDNPWPGLETYRESEQQYFRGRQEETEELYRFVMRARLTVLFGLSGLGKSSLIQAGLFPMLRHNAVLPVYVRFDFSAPELDLIGQVKAAIAREAASAQVESPALRPGESLWEYFHHRDHDFWNTRNRPVTPLLVFDQFEETFTLGNLDANRSKATGVFLEQLIDLSEGRPPNHLKTRLDHNPDEAKCFIFAQHNYKLLLSLREDFLPDLETLRLRMPTLALNRFRLRRMTGEAALLVVNQAPHLVDTAVAEEIVRFVAADEGHHPLGDLEVEPALLSLVCRELNNKRSTKNLSKITAGLLEGTRDQVLTEFYEHSVADLSLEVRNFIEDHLLTVSGFRDSIAEDNALSEPGVTQQAIDQLVERRLIRREVRSGVQRLELTHDRLCSVIRVSRNVRLLKETQDRERQALLEAQEDERRALLEAQEVEERRRDQRELRRTRVALFAIAVLFIATVAALWSAWNQRNEAVRLREQADLAAVTERAAKEEAEQQRQRAEKAVEMIQRSLVIRQAALSGSKQNLQQLLKSLDRTTNIRFRASERYLGYENESGKKVYQFGLFPEQTTLPTGQDAVAFITYLADHPTFHNALMIAGPERDFRVTYTGWGCLIRIIALVEYKNPAKTPTVTEFDMCKDLGW
jgi:hypothetical protein